MSTIDSIATNAPPLLRIARDAVVPVTPVRVLEREHHLAEQLASRLSDRLTTIRMQMSVGAGRRSAVANLPHTGQKLDIQA